MSLKKHEDDVFYALCHIAQQRFPMEYMHKYGNIIDSLNSTDNLDILIVNIKVGKKLEKRKRSELLF